MQRADFRLKLYRGVYAIVWREDGRTRRVSTGTANKDAAQRFLEDWLAGLNKPKDKTIATLWALYCDEKAGKPAVRRMGIEWKALSPDFAALEPDQVAKAHCDAYTARRRKEGRADGTIWTELNDLSTVLKWAVKRKHLKEAPHISKPSKPAPRDRYLSEAEVYRLRDAADAPHIRLAIILLLGTAARIGAILDLTWDRVDFENNNIKLSLDDGTLRKGRATVPMNRMTRVALDAAFKASMSDYVIEYADRPVKSIKTGFQAAVKRAGLTGVSPHVLRHTAAVHMARKGVSMSMIAQYLGHGDSRITERVYARFAPDHMAEAAAAVDFMRVTEI